MARLKPMLGYTAAALSILVMTAAEGSFILRLGGPLASALRLATSANWSGGEVVQTADHGAYRTEVHRPVFDALIGERRQGFVQVAWRPAAALPARVEEAIDTDADGRADFRIELETASRQAVLTPSSSDVVGLQGVYLLGEALAVRVTLSNPRK